MNISLMLTLGITTGLITALLVFIINILIQKGFIPRYESVKYTGDIVDGRWNFELPFGEHHRHIIVEITQHASLIKGISTHVAKSGEVPGDKLRTYKLHGKIHRHFILITGTPTNERRKGALIFLLWLEDDGQTLVGYISAYSTTRNKIIGSPCKLMRN